MKTSAGLLSLSLLPLAAAEPGAWRPAVEWGLFRAEVRSRVQMDGALRPQSSLRDPAWEVSRARIALDGAFSSRLSFQVEAELRDLETPWRDVYLEWRAARRLTVTAGRFKIPFGRDQLTSIHTLDFVFRSRLGDHLAPARDTGAMVEWKVRPRRWRVESGFFAGDGDNGKTGAATAAARLMFTAGAGKKSVARWGRVELGLAATSSRLPAGVTSLRVRNVLKETWFSRINAAGRRDRWGLEGEWRWRGFRATGEWMQAADQRRGQAISGADLASLRIRGYYTAAAYTLRRGWDAAARWERLSLGGGDPAYWPSRSPRARNVAANGERVWTFGLNWSPARHYRVQFNVVRATVDEPRLWDRTVRSGLWLPFVRLQFVL